MKMMMHLKKLLLVAALLPLFPTVYAAPYGSNDDNSNTTTRYEDYDDDNFGHTEFEDQFGKQIPHPHHQHTYQNAVENVVPSPDTPDR